MFFTEKFYRKTNHATCTNDSIKAGSAYPERVWSVLLGELFDDENAEHIKQARSSKGFKITEFIHVLDDDSSFNLPNACHLYKSTYSSMPQFLHLALFRARYASSDIL